MAEFLNKPSLLGKTFSEITDWVYAHGLPKYLTAQITHWLYKTNSKSFDEMCNIPKKTRELLQAEFVYGAFEPLKVSISQDGSKKYLYQATENKFIETAFIPEKARNTLCVSSQVGCKMGCLFCATGKQGFQAQLSAGQIINQLHSLPERETISNIVFMGMGEPFDNLPEVMKAQELLTSEYAFNLSIRKVTVSTVGIVPAMEVFLKESKCNLAVSLHSPFDKERRKLMPVEHVYPIKEVIDAINRHDIGKYRRVSFEYIVFGNMNDTPAHVKELAKLLNKTRCRVNLIRFHPVPHVPLHATNEARMLEFQKALMDKGIQTTIRASRGLDIEAACGLLSTKELNKKQNCQK